MRQSGLESRSVCLYLPNVFLPADAADSSAFATKPDRLNADVCRRAAPGKEASAIHTMPFSLYTIVSLCLQISASRRREPGEQLSVLSCGRRSPPPPPRARPDCTVPPCWSLLLSLTRWTPTRHRAGPVTAMVPSVTGTGPLMTTDELGCGFWFHYSAPFFLLLLFTVWFMNILFRSSQMTKH